MDTAGAIEFDVSRLIRDTGEVLAGHAGFGAIQTIKDVPFLVCYRTLLLSSSYDLLLVDGVWSREISEECAAAGDDEWART